MFKASVFSLRLGTDHYSMKSIKQLLTHKSKMPGSKVILKRVYGISLKKQRQAVPYLNLLILLADVEWPQITFKPKPVSNGNGSKK